MSEDEYKGALATVQDVAKLLKDVGYEVSEAAGLLPGTVEWFATLRTGLARSSTYFKLWERWPEALEEELADLEERRKARQADRALTIVPVIEGKLPEGYKTDLEGRSSNAITLRRLYTEITGHGEIVRRSMREYEQQKGPLFYIPRRGRASSGEIVDAVAYLKRWVSAGGTDRLGVVGSRFSGRSEVVERAIYELAVEFVRNPENVVTLQRNLAVGAKGAVAMRARDGRFNLVSVFPVDEFDPSRAEGEDYIELLPLESAEIESWFGEQFRDTNGVFERFLAARKSSSDFMTLSNELPNVNRLVKSMKAATPNPAKSTVEWIAQLIADYMSTSLSEPCMLSTAAGGLPAEGKLLSRTEQLEDVALEQFALGKPPTPTALADLWVSPPVEAILSTWIGRDTHLVEAGSVRGLSFSSVRFSNALIRDYFLARKLAREIKAGNTELLTRYQFPKEYVLLFLAILSPEAAAQITADKVEAMRNQIETEVERRLQLTLAHQLKRSVGALRLQFKLIRKKIRQDDAEALHDEYARIEEELTFLAALEKQTRLWYEVPNGSPEALPVYEFMIAAAEPLHERYPGVRCDLDVDANLRVRATRGILREICHCLLENSFHAAAILGRDRVPHVRVRSIVEGGIVRIEVIDNGAGVAPSDRERIFEPYVTTKKGGEDGMLGTGLGLTIARKYAEHIGGQIGLDAEHPETCFYARFVIWRDGP